jgi:hypothetical protein
MSAAVRGRRIRSSPTRPASACSRCAFPRAADALAQQHDPVPDAHSVDDRVLAAAYQVSQRLVFGIWYPDRGQVSAAQTAKELESVTAIGLDAIPGLRGTKDGATTM